MAGPLQGIVVLDLSRILAGPWATQVLADYGATVLKVEHPQGGDDTRKWGPPYLKDAAGRATGESAYYLSANRGKRSLAIDFSQPDGQQLVRRLAMQADVLVENFKVGGLARYGLGYEQLTAENPRLVYLSISAFGQDGPDAAKPGYDAMIQGMGGLMSLTGLPEGEPGAGPQKVGVAVADLMCGMYAVSAIIAALYERDRSGRGQFIDLSLLDTQVAWLANQNLNYLVSGEPPARFKTNADRVAHRAALVPQVAVLLRQRTTREWLAALEVAQVPCGPINDLAQVFDEPQVRHRGLRMDLPHLTAGTAPGVRNPVRFSRSAVEYERAPPPLGADTTAELKARLGIDDAVLADLVARGVIA